MLNNLPFYKYKLSNALDLTINLMDNELYRQDIIFFDQAQEADAKALLDLVNGCYRGESAKQGWTHESDILGGQRTDLCEIENLIKSQDEGFWILKINLSKISSSFMEHPLIKAIKSHEVQILGRGDILGCVHIQPRKITAYQGKSSHPKGIYFGMLCVQPILQGYGLGRLILQRVLDEARSEPPYRVWMTVIEQRTELIRYYQRCGFSLTGKSLPFPMDDPRRGIPKVPSISFIEMEQFVKPRLS